MPTEDIIYWKEDKGDNYGKDKRWKDKDKISGGTSISHRIHLYPTLGFLR